MPTTDLGACEWFAWDMRRSNLIARDRLDAVVAEFMAGHPGAEPPALADYLVAKGLLTPFQAGRLLQGKTEGFVLGPFTLVDALGTGSMGAVYKAVSKTDAKPYAVKILPRRSMWNMRLARRKVRAFEQCGHPAVVPFADAGTSGGMHYLAWPLIEGESLDKLVERHGKLDAGRAADLGAQAAEGLDACHKQGLFHGLLKPSNLMVGPDGSVRILDLGIGSLLAETADESLVDTMSTANSVNSGLDCASPESITDPTKLTPLGDQYSLGCVLYYCLTGQYPFPGGTAVEKMVGHQHKQPPPIKSLTADAPDGLAAVVERLMTKAPAERYATAADAAEALRPFAVRPKSVVPPVAAPTSEPAPPEKPRRTAAPAVRTTPTAPPKRPRGRRRLLAVGVALCAVGVALCIVLAALLANFYF